ncbi:MAG: ThiF family adenylyltransferase [Deltaproteobacteria bacterium]|nr:ThiF family adenylyltransferase [Deltaproteobacteria bacterium]
MIANPSGGPIQPGGRYARQTVLRVIGPEGQQRLSKSTVLIVGCGALGSAQAELLARAGLGRLILVDRDVIELHNLQRQFLFDELDVSSRMPKALAAERRLREINSEIKVEGLIADVTPANIADLVRQADLVLDGTDNFETRYLINDAAIKEGKPWVYGGVVGTDGMVMAIRPGRGPCLRCIFPEPPEAGQLPTCETQGVLNTAVSWVAALQVTEAFKLLAAEAAGEFPLYALDIWTGSITSISVKQNEDCVCCGRRRFEFLDAERGSSSTVFCGRNAVQVTPEKLSKPDFKQLTERLKPLGPVTVNGLVLEFALGDHRMVVFPDSRVLVMGTTDTAEARSLVAKYIGS